MKRRTTYQRPQSLERDLLLTICGLTIVIVTLVLLVLSEGQ